MNHGRDSIYFQIDGDDVTGSKLHEIVAKRFSFVSMGHSFRCTEFEAAIGLAQMGSRDRMVSARQANARRLTEGLKDLEEHLQLPTTPAGQEHMFMLYGLVLRHEDKTGLVRWLEDHRIETRDMLPLINQPVYRKIFGDLEPQYPVARRINRCGFYVGCHQYLSRADVDYVVDRIHAYFKRRL